MKNKPLMKLAVCLIGMAALVLQSRADGDINHDRLYGSWASMDDKPDVLAYKEGKAYKMTIFTRSGKIRRLGPQTYLLMEEDDNLLINTGYRIDISYNGETDILISSPDGDYVRKEERP